MTPEASAPNFRCGQLIEIDGFQAEVMFSWFTQSYSADFPLHEWTGPNYEGMMVREFGGSGLVFYPKDWFDHPHHMACRIGTLGDPAT